MEKTAKIYVAGHRGMVGSAIVRKLQTEGYSNLVLRTSSELDLRNQTAVENFFSTEKPEYVFLAAAKVGGIMANNTYRADFLYENLMIESNVIHQSYLRKVKKLLFLGSSCIYPKFAPQPLKEEYLLSGYLEETNEPYAIAKIAGIKLCESYRVQYGCNFISAMPSNLYGPNDGYDLQSAHVLPALVRKFTEAQKMGLAIVDVWGSGKPLREFLHVDDLANACFILMNNYNAKEFINIGSGKEVSIVELVELIKVVTGFSGEVRWDFSKPDGTLRKVLNISKMKALNWEPTIDLMKGLKAIYELYNNKELV